jgi:sugar phosphate permease
MGIVLMQLSTAIAMFAFGLTQNVSASLVLYLSVTGLQFMSGPGIYSLLMSQLPEADRSPPSALQNMTGSLSHAGVAVVAGFVIVRYGYSALITGNAGVAVAAALLLLLLLGSKTRHSAPEPQVAETS